MKRHQVPLKLITEEEAKGRSIFKKTPNGPQTPFFKSDDTIDLICGNCDAILVEGMRRDRMEHAVLVCYECGSYNDTL
jgi:hypothetical protein